MQMMDLHFTKGLFKLMIGKSIEYEDLESLNPTLYLTMNKILKTDNVSSMELTFITDENDFGKNNIHELVENGEDTLVTDDNKHQFIELYSKWKLYESVKLQLESILTGLYEVIPRPYFSIFDENELELLLCGSPFIDLDDWKIFTVYEGGYNKDDEVIQLFWEFVEGLDQLHRSKLLQFVTGTCIF
jgi:E3 ubiquitin-protein ligase HUWE1